MKTDHNSDPLEDDDVQVQRTSVSIPPVNFYGRGEVGGKTRALRSADKPKISRELPKPRTPSPERWTRTHPGWDKNWLKSIIYPATGKKTATVDKQDIERLDEGEFLNDNLIMFYLYWLEQHNSHLASRVYVHNTFFYASLTNTAKGNRGINYEAVQRWTAKVDLPSYDYIIVPVNEHTHWYVAIICNASRLLEPEAKLPAEVIEVESRNGTDISEVSPATNSRPHSSGGDLKTPVTKGRRKVSHPPRVYDPKEPRIITFDSLGMAHSATCRNLRDYIVREIDTRTGVSVTPPKFLGMTAKNIATQNNYCDCGVFLLGYMEEFFARPDAFIEDIMQSKYDNKGYNTDPSKLRAKIRDIVFDLQDEVRKTEEPRKSKQVKVKAKKDPTKDKTLVEPSVSQSVSNLPSKSTRTSPAVELPNNEKAPISSAQSLAPPSPAPQAPKDLPEVINLDDSQDQVGHEHNDSISTVVQPPSSVPIEDPLPKQHVSSKATSPAPVVRRHRPMRSFGKLEIPDSQEERAADNQGDDGHANESQNSQVVSLATRTADLNQQPAVDIANNGTETKTPTTTKSLLSGLSSIARTLNPFARNIVIENTAPEEGPDRYSSARDRDQRPAIPPEKTDVRFETRESHYPDASRSNRGVSPPRDAWRSASQLKSPSPMSDDADYVRKHTSNADEEVELVLEAKAIPRKAASANPVDLTEDDEPDVMLLDTNFPDVPLLPNSSPVSSKGKQPRAHSESAVANYKRKRTPAQRERIHDQASVDLTSPRKERSSKDIPNHQGYPMTNQFKSRDAVEEAMIRRQGRGH
ncbi:ulp1 protease family protein [Rutstroemia sp. NJR-2017a BBW]|nr:ulp1 protease family protein [Rutstroemia sp. NJR-2017a BBW]